MGTISKLPRSWQKPVGQAVSQVFTFCRIVSWALVPRSAAGGLQSSVLVPATADVRPAGNELLDYALALAGKTAQTNVSSLGRLNLLQAAQAQLWPGEHYRLLKALVADLKPKLVVEIGTFTGLSALIMLESLPAGSRIITYDLAPWDRFPDTVLRKEDFARGLEQRLGNLCAPEYFASQRDALLEADLIFMDGPKNGDFEPRFFEQLRTERRKPGLMIWDDIRLLQMIEMWRTLDLPKLDLTSLGHWTGTGLVRIGQKE